MARYLVGEVEGTLYWHEIDEAATLKLRKDLEGTDLGHLMCQTTKGLKFGTTPFNTIPKSTSHALYKG